MAMNKLKIILNGLTKENPTLVLLLGMCPTLGTTSSAFNGLGMGLATTFVLICSNMVVSSVKKLIPDAVRIPAYIVIIATFTTLVQMLLEAYVPSLYASLGIFLPLIVVNCIVLGRAESFAAKNNVIDSAMDGIGIGLGFTAALTVIGLVREILGSGMAFGTQLYSNEYGALVFVLAPGAFIVLGFIIGIKNAIDRKRNQTA